MSKSRSTNNSPSKDLQIGGTPDDVLNSSKKLPYETIDQDKSLENKLMTDTKDLLMSPENSPLRLEAHQRSYEHFKDLQKLRFEALDPEPPQETSKAADDKILKSMKISKKLDRSRFNTDFLHENITENTKEYTYHSWDHLKKSRMCNFESEATIKLTKHKAEYFDEEEEVLRHEMNKAPKEYYLKKGVSLAYQYNPEHCFNNMIDVIDMNHRQEPLDAEKIKEIPTISLKYAPRIFAEEKDSLYNKNEFPEKYSATERKRLQNPSEYRRLKTQLKDYTNYMRNKRCFLLRKGNEPNDMLDCLEPSEDYYKETHKNSDEEALDSHRDQHPQRAQTQKLSKSPHQQGAEHEKYSDKNHFQALPATNEASHHEKEQKQVHAAYVKFNDKYMNNLVEVDIREAVAKRNLIRKNHMTPEAFYDGLIDHEKVLESVEALNWSGEQIFSKKGYSRSKTEKVVDALNNQILIVWMQGTQGLWKYVRSRCNYLIFHPLAEFVILTCVIVNGILLILEPSLPKDWADGVMYLEVAFTCLFFLEMVFKLIALGFTGYLKSITNVIDGVVVVISIIQTTVNLSRSNSAHSDAGGGLQSLTVMRMIRIFRIVRYLKKLRFMNVIIAVVSRAASQFLLVALILLILMFVFLLVGSQIYYGKMTYSNLPPRYNFDKLLSGFIILLQLLTMKNWIEILEALYASEVSHAITLIYILAWIIIGNYIIFNLFLATLLGGFESPEAHKQLEENNDEFKELGELIQKSYKEKRETQEKIAKAKELEDYAINFIVSKKINPVADQQIEERVAEQNPEDKKKRGEYYLDRDEISEDESSEEELTLNMIEKHAKPKEERAKDEGKYFMYKRIHCNTSLYIFRKENPFRMFITRIVINKW